MTDDDPVMPFGKYRGARVSQLPFAYLDWLVANEVVKDATLREAVEEAYMAYPDDESRPIEADSCGHDPLRDGWGGAS